jgi:ZIP family zinc transporter
MTITTDGNLGVAFGLVCGAGAATAIGSSVVFFPTLVKLASRRMLAASLGLSAGVMLYVSFVEIFTKSVAGFTDAGFPDDTAYIYTTLSFFGGILVMKLVDMCVKRLSRDNTPRRRDYDEDIEIVWDEEGCCELHQDALVPHCVGCAKDPVGELEEWHQQADLELKAREDTVSSTGEEQGAEIPEGTDNVENAEPPSERQVKAEEKTPSTQIGESLDSDAIIDRTEEEVRSKPVRLVLQSVPRPTGEDAFFRAPSAARLTPKDEKRRLVNMGLGTALAIGLHNFPEGLATFVAALDDPSAGAVLAIAIGIHNIPEGLCVSLPIYYATGNRWKAFMWGCLSGLSEPIAALLGWLILASVITDTTYAVLFGFVGGMMVTISLQELIPTAHRYDAEDKVVTYSVIVGMAIMALSLALSKL